jgi:hypothetical protein
MNDVIFGRKIHLRFFRVKLQKSKECTALLPALSQKCITNSAFAIWIKILILQHDQVAADVAIGIRRMCAFNFLSVRAKFCPTPMQTAAY